MPSSRIAATVERAGLWRAQTPQGFRFADILAAHEAAAAAGRNDLTDDAAVAEWAGLAVTLVDGSEANRKLTTAEDLAMAQNAGQRPCPTCAPVRVSMCTALSPGDHVWLCGVKIAHTHALEGHSDADVGLHALTDALLGAIGDGDIGQHFPNTDPRWKGAASHLFLPTPLRACRRAAARSPTSMSPSCARRPRLRPHRDAMRQRIAEVLGIDVGPRRRQGHHDRRPWLYRPPRGHRRPCHSNRDPAVTPAALSAVCQHGIVLASRHAIPGRPRDTAPPNRGKPHGQISGREGCPMNIMTHGAVTAAG